MFMTTIDQIYSIFLRHPDICTDSRQIRDNALFFALKGDHFNGNHYAKDALEKGAAYAVVDDPEVVTHERFLLVEDVLMTLQQLARHHRKKLNLPVIAITGTNGKTTTKEVTAAVLSTRFRVEYTRGNLNNHIGVPLTLLSMNEQTEIGIVEMGANHPGEIDFLCRIALPDYGLVTNMGKAHLEGFGGLEGVIRTKSELYRYLAENSGTVFINGDNPLLTSSVGTQKELVEYGSGKDARLKGGIINEPPFCTLSISEKGQHTLVRSRLIGNYNAENILAAASIGRYFRVPMELIAKAIENYSPSNSRSQLLVKGTNRIILDAYNANPTSMALALSNFISMEADNKVVILGDMLELGENSHAEHQTIVDQLKGTNLQALFLVGNSFKQTSKPDYFLSFADKEELIRWLLIHPLYNNTVLIKGSHGIRLDRIVDAIN
jgi:UDP-N-acetylmuramoyl-tripeptide--D-alanyl-D-alanine ligase